MVTVGAHTDGGEAVRGREGGGGGNDARVRCGADGQLQTRIHKSTTTPFFVPVWLFSKHFSGFVVPCRVHLARTSRPLSLPCLVFLPGQVPAPLDLRLVSISGCLAVFS